MLHLHEGGKVHREMCCGFLGGGQLYQLVAREQAKKRKKDISGYTSCSFLIFKRIKSQSRDICSSSTRKTTRDSGG